MPAEYDAGNGSVNIALADHLSANKDSFLSDWRTRVLSDSEIGTARSVNTSIQTHRLPFLLDGLTNTLRHYCSAGVVVNESGDPAIRRSRDTRDNRVAAGIPAADLPLETLRRPPSGSRNGRDALCRVRLAQISRRSHDQHHGRVPLCPTRRKRREVAAAGPEIRRQPYADGAIAGEKHVWKASLEHRLTN